MHPYRTPAEMPPDDEDEARQIVGDYFTWPRIALLVAGTVLLYSGWLGDIASFFLWIVLLNGWPLTLFVRKGM